mgnify:CR=1 FL=1
MIPNDIKQAIDDYEKFAEGGGRNALVEMSEGSQPEHDRGLVSRVWIAAEPGLKE